MCLLSVCDRAWRQREGRILDVCKQEEPLPHTRQSFRQLWKKRAIWERIKKWKFWYLLKMNMWGGPAFPPRTASVLLGTLAVGWKMVPNILENRPVDVGAAKQQNALHTSFFQNLSKCAHKQMFLVFCFFAGQDLWAAGEGNGKYKKIKSKNHNKAKQ